VEKKIAKYCTARERQGFVYTVYLLQGSLIQNREYMYNGGIMRAVC